MACEFARLTLLGARDSEGSRDDGDGGGGGGGAFLGTTGNKSVAMATWSVWKLEQIQGMKVV